MRFKQWDLLLGLGFAIMGGALGGYILWRAGFADVYAIFMPELVYHACGFGWVRPVTMPAPLLDFVFMRTHVLDCAALSFPDQPVFGRGIFLQSQLYLAWAAGWAWQLSSVAFSNLWPVAAVLTGAYAWGCFALLRLFFTRWQSVFGAAILALSPIMLSMVVMMRDFSKAPFFVWSLVFLLLAVRSSRGWRSIGWAAAAGVAIGIGYGFRADTIIMLPIGVTFLALVWPRSGWLSRIVAGCVFVTATLLVASPMFVTKNSGGFGSLLMQGLTEPYQNYLGLGSAPYSFGTKYSDELTLSSIAADISADDPQWAVKEGRQGESMTQSVLRSGPYVLGWLPYFAGDVATQALKSAVWIMGMPALVSPPRQAQVWRMPVPGRQSFVTPPTNRFYDLIARPWLPWLGLVGLIVFLWQAFAARRSEAIALALTFGAMLAYTVVQFAVRHVFHLEFFWVIALLAIARIPFHWQPMREAAKPFLELALILLGATIAIRLGLVAYQERAIQDRLTKLLALPREEVSTQNVSAPDGKTMIRVDVPPRYRQLVNGPPDSMDNTMGQRGTQWEVIASADRLLVTIDRAACPSEPILLKIQYAKRPTFWQSQDYDITVDLKAGPRQQILLPALYRATQYFDGIEVDPAFAPCITKIERIVGEKTLPVALMAVLPADWASRPLHRTFGGFGTVRPSPSYFGIN